MKLSEKKYLKHHIKNFTFLAKFLYYIGVTNLKCFDEKIWNNNNDYHLKIRELNPYNPISYIIFVVLFLFSGLINGFGNLKKKDVINLFKF